MSMARKMIIHWFSLQLFQNRNRIITCDYKYNEKFINISDKEMGCYHIYFDNSNEEIKRNNLEENEKV